MKFRPCIDIHNGKVKQIVGGSLKDAGDQARENFVSGQDAAFYAELYKNAGLKGGHVILLNGKDSEYYEATRNQALKALAAYPGGLQIGGGVLSATMETSSSFRLRRILVWLHPEDYASGDGYQTIQALYAIGSGGFLGRGLGNSIQKLGSVPEAQNDMIFSIVCEELGILGGMIVLLLFAYLLYRLFFIAQNASDLFGSLIVSGIFIHIALQVIFNIAVVVNLMPNTGVTLPFISYGGTSILFLMAEMGLALSVARQIKFKEPERLL